MTWWGVFGLIVILGSVAISVWHAINIDYKAAIGADGKWHYFYRCECGRLTLAWDKDPDIFFHEGLCPRCGRYKDVKVIKRRFHNEQWEEQNRN